MQEEQEVARQSAIAQEKARQYDIAVDIITWIISQYKGQRSSITSLSPHLNALGMWLDIQHNLNLVPRPDLEEEDGQH